MDNISLIRPTPEYLEAFHDLCVESWNNIHDHYLLRDPATFFEWKQYLFEDYLKEEVGETLPSHLVPSVTFWALASSRLVGVVNIRLKLNARLKEYGGHIGIVIRPTERHQGYASRFLPLCIERAGKLGIKEVLLTCIEDNGDSLKSLESFPCTRKERDVAVIDGHLKRIRRFYFSTG
ncbi:MAG: GNAT family N-acetyltransferase [Thermoguttaceae bacterium]|nr:GNAT family N-acetyltransferase [Thermoguttaceae bacterium]